MKPRRLLQAILVSLLLLLPLKRDSLPPQDYWRYRLDSLVRSEAFNWPDYEVRAILDKLFHRLQGVAAPDDEVSFIRGYFELVAQIDGLRSERQRLAAERAAPSDIQSAETQLSSKEKVRVREEEVAEDVLQRQVEEILLEEGIASQLPLLGRIVFPPVEFEFQDTPLLLVISRRDRIETVQSVSLLPTLTLEQMEEIERDTDALGFSSLVVPTGGMGSYPPILPQVSSLSFILGAIVHEWTHNYLFFHPLGWHYSDSQEMTTINETLASMVEEEVSLEIMKRYYPDLYAQKLEEKTREREEPRPGQFDFNAFMRETRLQVDDLLAQGDVEQAERYMEERRQALLEQGIYERKINQAYFAFYGSYATMPSSVSPIGGQLRELRSKSATLSQFLELVSGFYNYQDLLQALSSE